MNEVKLPTEDIEFYRKTLERIAKVVGITTPLILIAMAKDNEETYADILVRAIGELLAAKDAEIERLKIEVVNDKFHDVDLLEKYSRWLEKHSFLDSDWYTEGNTVHEFMELGATELAALKAGERELDNVLSEVSQVISSHFTVPHEASEYDKDVLKRLTDYRLASRKEGGKG